MAAFVVALLATAGIATKPASAQGIHCYVTVCYIVETCVNGHCTETQVCSQSEVSCWQEAL